MSDCCSPGVEEVSAPAEAQDTGHCPACGGAGKVVQTQTVRAMVAVSLREVRGQRYRFCVTPGCAVVYYEAATGACFTQEQLREPVYQKQPGRDDPLICYCFRHTVGAVRHGGNEQREQIIANITAGIQAGQCACELRNPQGSCCLGNVRGLMRRLTQAVS